MKLASFIPLALLLGIVACKRKDDAQQELSPRDKLLGSWRRVLRANDYNGNGLIDSSEITHAPATDTLILTLVPDATYSRILTYKSEPFPERGTWHLQHADGEIVFQPTTSTSAVDTLAFDTLAQDYFQVRTAYPHGVPVKWEAFRRPN